MARQDAKAALAVERFGLPRTCAYGWRKCRLETEARLKPLSEDMSQGGMVVRVPAVFDGGQKLVFAFGIDRMRSWWEGCAHYGLVTQ